MRGLVKFAVLLLAVVFSLLVSLMVHLDTALGREQGRILLNDYVSGQMAGTLEAGPIEQLRFWHCIVKDTYVYDPNGEKIIYAETIHLGLDPIAGMLGKLRFTYANLRKGWVKLIDNGVGEPTFIDAFLPADDTPSEGDPLHAIVDDMDLQGVDVFGEILGLQGLRMENMHVTGRMEFYHVTDFDIRSATGMLVEPFPFHAKLEALQGHIFTDEQGTRLRAEMSKGDEYLVAYLTYRPPPGKTIDDPYVLRLRLLPDEVDAQTLKDVKFEWAQTLTGKLSGQVLLKLLNETMYVDGEVDTSGGAATVHGRFPSEGPTTATIRSQSAELAKILEGAPDITVSGEVSFRNDPSRPEDTLVDVNVEPFEYSGYQVPAVRGRAVLEPDGIQIDKLRGPYAGGDLTVSGKFAYAGNSDLRVRGAIPQVADDANIRQLVPGLRGSAEFDVRLRQQANGRVDARGWVAFDDFRYGVINADVLQLDGKVGGQPSSPQVDVNIEGGNVKVAGYPLGHGEILLQGGPRKYNAEGGFLAKGRRRAEFRTRVELDDGTFIVNTERLEVGVGDLVWRGALDNVVLDPESHLSFDRVRMGNAEQRLEAKGTWRFDGPDSIRADLKNYDLAALTIVFPDDAPEVSGRADLHFEFEGDIDRRPQIRAEGTFTDASLWGISPVNAAYLLTYGEGDLILDAQVGMETRGSFSLSVTGLLEPDMVNPVQNLREGVYDVSLAAGGLDLTLFERWMPDDAPDFDGFADAKIRLEGPIDAPTFRGDIRVPSFRYEDWSLLDVRSEFQYEYGSLVARASAADPKGDLAEIEGSLLVDVVNLVKNPTETVSTLDTSPWRLSFRIPPRTLDALPMSLRHELSDTAQNMQLAASATLAGGAFRTRGDLHASLDWRADFGDDLCATSARPRATIRATLENDETRVRLDGLVGTNRVIQVKANANTPVDAWLRAAVKPERPVTQLTARIDNAPSEDIPYLCQFAGGPLYGELEMANLFGDDPQLRLVVQSPELRARRVEPAIRAGNANTIVETPPATLGLVVAYAEGTAELDTKVRWWNGGASDIKAKLPMMWDKTMMAPQVADEGDMDADAHFDQMPLQAALAWMSGVLSAEGLLEGNVSAKGDVNRPDMVGHVRLSDGRVGLRTVGQTLRDVHGTLIFDEEGVFVKDLHAADGGGSAEINGQLVLKGLTPEAASLVVKADGFPVRQEGSVVASVVGNANLRASFGESQLEGDVNVNKLNVEVPASTATPQGLAPHPEVFFIGQEAEASDASSYRVGLNLRANKPFRVGSQEQGFDAKVTADLRASYDADQFAVRGDVSLDSGYFEVFGKRFDVQSGFMKFDGGAEINPRVNLVAQHSFRGTNDSVIVTASGRLDGPAVEFRCSVDVESEAQCISFLLTGRTAVERGSQANQQAAGAEAVDFLNGVVTGVVASGLKSEFGRFAPTVGVRGSGDTGNEETQVVIGFDVGSLIPNRYRSVIQGLYVEGQFTARRAGGGQDSTGQAQRPGFLLEALWPRRLVTTGTAAPPSNWSIDLTWEP